MGSTPQEIESYRRKNRHDNISGSTEMIKKWRQSLIDRNQVAAMCELMVKANIKPQADEFYEKCDRIINAKTLKILKGMIKDAPLVPTKEKITNHENTVIKSFDERGGRLYLKRYDVTLEIPSGALERGSSRQIALKVLTSMAVAAKVSGEGNDSKSRISVLSFGYDI